MAKLDTADPAMKDVLNTLESGGMQAAKSALADHFRKRTTPRWWIDPHARPKYDSRPAGVKTSKADQAVRHVYRGFDFGPNIDWLDNPSYAPDREFDKEWSMDDAICGMLKSFYEMGHHLEQYSSVREISSNWLIYETRGLHTVATLFPEFADAKRWLALSEERLTNELTKQVYPDGVQWELAPGYGGGVLKAFRRAHQLGVLNGRPMPDEYVATLEGMVDYFSYSSVHGQTAAFCDSGHGSVRGLLSDGFGDFPNRTDFPWMVTGGRKGDKPRETNRTFPYAGHFVTRSGWDADQRFMIVDAGPFGSNHQHEDALSFELSAYGTRLITDAGSYRYNYDSPWRKFMVSSLARNTLAVDHTVPPHTRSHRAGAWAVFVPMLAIQADDNNVSVGYILSCSPFLCIHAGFASGSERNLL